MTIKSMIAKLEKAGYTVTFCMSGAVVVTKGCTTERGNSLTAIYKRLF